MIRRLELDHIRHIIFDLDGTLWDPTEMSMEAWRRACLSVQVDPSILDRKRFAIAYGHPAHAVASIVLPGLPQQLQQRILVLANDLENELIGTGSGTLFEGVPKVLASLGESKRLYVCSNCQAGYIEAFLETYALGHLIADTICSGDTGLDKSTNLGLLLERNHMEYAVMVGDMESDRKAAKANHVPFIHAAYGFGTTVPGERSISSIRELPGMLDPSFA